MNSTAISDWNSLAPNGTDVEFHQVCESTNVLANLAGADGAEMPKWYVAKEQKTGRGRRGRIWSSPIGNFYGSYLFRPQLDMPELACLPFLVSLAVRDTFLKLGCSSETVLCKWPNDVLVSEKKASGILIESNAEPKQTKGFVVIGIGLNLAHFPDDAQFPATSVTNEVNVHPSIKSAFKILSHTLDKRLHEWSKQGAASTINEWRAHAWGIGMRREIRTNNESFHATLIGLDDDGGLSLRLDNGIEKKLYAGDVFASPSND